MTLSVNAQRKFNSLDVLQHIFTLGGMALTATQQAARVGKLTGSRIACLMTGDAQKILQLYLEMIGEAEPEDLRHVWAVRLGEATEQLNLDWFQEKNRLLVTRRGEVVIHANGWAACTLDGWVEDTDATS
jgi:hypothetical protein